jgi:hypothetical protein
MAARDPFEVLSLPRNASVAEVAAARRRLARSLHPDRGGDASAMQEVNRAADEALGLIATRSDAGHGWPDDWADAQPSCVEMPSFVVEALPVVTHAALMQVAAQMGSVIDDDPPYLLEVIMTEGLAVALWCRLEVLPEAGSSSVGISVAPDAMASADRSEAVDLEWVRDLWIAGLNDLEWSDL